MVQFRLQTLLASNGRFGMGALTGGKDKNDAATKIRQTLSNRIEDILSRLLIEMDNILEKDQLQVLTLAHSLEIFNAHSGDDLVAVIEGIQGTIIDDLPHKDRRILAKNEKYLEAALVAHRDRHTPEVPIPLVSSFL
ncbi:MAG: hypothetical protein Q8M88_03175 [Phenylobacterium sp.]|uniref:hypothetical protein n=1 Tax=Phenylobacterium sp. TaxID=1871053 RepID=UPI0027328035|nr:hypothetical protein [Phenylobacterium sp.]MDP3173420.1 hypothetical protein [Phenylobacterium sp.]